MTARTGPASYKGKGVYYWMFQTRSSSLDANPGLKAIGTNAVPYLARALRAQPTLFDQHAWLRQPRVQAILRTIAPGFRLTRTAPEVRAAAAFSLLTFGFEARPALAELHAALSDPSLDEQTCQSVVFVLLQIGPPPESLPHLLAAWRLTTNGAFSFVRSSLVYTISRLSKYAPERCLPVFLDELNAPEADRRHAAVWGVSGLGRMAHAAVPALERMLADTNGYSQFAAAVALGQVTNAVPALVPRLRALAHGTNGQASAGVALTLWRWGQPAEQSVGILTNLLSDPAAKGLAAEYLGAMGLAAKPAVPALLQASQQDIGAWVDRYDRAQCALAALRIGGPNELAVRELEAALKFRANAWVRCAVASGLAGQGELARPLVPALRRNLEDEDRDVRQSAATALKKIEETLRKAPHEKPAK